MSDTGKKIESKAARVDKDLTDGLLPYSPKAAYASLRLYVFDPGELGRRIAERQWDNIMKPIFYALASIAVFLLVGTKGQSMTPVPFSLDSKIFLLTNIAGFVLGQYAVLRLWRSWEGIAGEIYNCLSIFFCYCYSFGTALVCLALFIGIVTLLSPVSFSDVDNTPTWVKMVTSPLIFYLIYLLTIGHAKLVRIVFPASFWRYLLSIGAGLLLAVVCLGFVPENPSQ